MLWIQSSILSENSLETAFALSNDATNQIAKSFLRLHCVPLSDSLSWDSLDFSLSSSSSPSTISSLVLLRF